MSSRALSSCHKKQAEKRAFPLFSNYVLVEYKSAMLQVSGFLVLFLVLKAAVWMVTLKSDSELAAFFV